MQHAVAARDEAVDLSLGLHLAEVELRVLHGGLPPRRDWVGGRRLHVGGQHDPAALGQQPHQLGTVVAQRARDEHRRAGAARRARGRRISWRDWRRDLPHQVPQAPARRRRPHSEPLRASDRRKV